MKAYQFDHEGLFVGSVDMQVDPLESKRAGREIHLVPAGATTQAPPPVAEGSRVRWTGSLWISEPIPDPVPDERDVTPSEGPAAPELSSGSSEPVAE